MQIVNVIILYKNKEEVIKYVNDLSKQNLANNIALVIVINDYGDSSYEDIRTSLPFINMSVEIFPAGTNLGYFNGFLYGVNKYIDIHGNEAEWYVLSNTDIEYRDIYFYDGFGNQKYSDDTWCVGPSIYKKETRSYQNPEADERRSKRKMQLLFFIFNYKYLARLYLKLSKLKHSKPMAERPISRFVYEIHGAFFALRKEFIEIIRNRSYGAFLYSEETYVSEELLKIGKKTYYDSDIEIIHNEHSVTGAVSFDRKAKYIAESLKYLIDSYY